MKGLGLSAGGGEEILELGILRTVMETEADTLTSGASCSVFSACGFLGLAEISSGHHCLSTPSLLL